MDNKTLEFMARERALRFAQKNAEAGLIKVGDIISKAAQYEAYLSGKPASSPERQRALDKRDDTIRRIEKLRQTQTGGDLGEARKLWKQETHYHRRSLAKTAMYRYKTVFGGAVRARRFDNQSKELCLNIVAMNKMTRLGIPSAFAST